MKSSDDAGTSLISAVKAGQADIVLSALRQGADPNVTDKDGLTLLHHAIQNNHLDVLKLLLIYDIDLNRPDGQGRTPLMEAAMHNNGDAVSALLGAGAKLELSGQNDVTEYAVEHNYLPVQHAISGVTVQSLTQTNKNFLKLIQSAHVEEVERYLKKKIVNPNYIDANGKGYLIYAMEALAESLGGPESEINQLKKIINLLIEYGANPNQQSPNGNTPLLLAAETDQIDIAEKLLQKGANPNKKLNGFITPLMIAADVGDRKLCRLLTANGSELITEENIEIIERDGMLLQFFAESARTPAMCEAAVKKNRMAIRYVPEALQTTELCEYAAVNYAAIKHIKNAGLRQSLFDKADKAIDSRYDVVISGMGPTALAAANEAARAGKSVLIISDRNQDFVRVQRVLLEPDVTLYLRRSLNEDDSDFLGSIPIQVQQNNVAIKDAERYLFEQVSKLREQGHRIDFLFESQITEATLKDGVVAIGSKDRNEGEKVRTVEFDYLLGADGTGRHALKVLNKNNQLPEIQVVETPTRYNPNHATIYLTVKMKDGQPFEFPKDNANNIYFEGLHTGIFFDLESNRKSGYKSIKCSFTCEIPKAIREMPDKQKAREAFLEIVRDRMQETFEGLNLPSDIDLEMSKTSMKYGEYKDRLKYSMFGTKDVMLTQSAAERNGKIYASAGDVVSDPDYRSGQGFNNGLRNAQAFGLLVSKEISVDEYNIHCKARAKEMRDVLEGNSLQTFEEPRESPKKTI